MTTYNGERFLQQQLESLTTLDPGPAEVVICDDGSTDSTFTILRAFEEKAPFPVYITQNAVNIGWRQNFLKTAALCKSKFIGFCDQDDIWYPHKLGMIAPFFSDPEVLLIHHEANVINEAGVYVGRLREGENDKLLTPRLTKPTNWSHAPGFTIVFARSLLNFTPFWPYSVDPGQPHMPAAHDQWVYHLASNLGNIRYIPEPLVAYRQHNGNQIGFHSKRNNAFASPKALKKEIAIQADMLAGFAKALEQALAEGKTGYATWLTAAIDANQSLQRRLSLRKALYQNCYVGSRLALFIELLKTGSYKQDTHWNLGRRSLLADFRAVLHGPR